MRVPTGICGPARPEADQQGEVDRMRVVRFVTLAAAVFGMAAILPGQLAAQATKPPVVPHDLEGKANCLMCHSGKMPNIKGIPAESHKDYTNDNCLLCHGKGSPLMTGTPPAIPHDLQGKDNCVMCHSGKMPNIKAPPAETHKDIGVKDCTLCHKPKG
jgi:hypothetical protein